MFGLAIPAFSRLTWIIAGAVAALAVMSYGWYWHTTALNAAVEAAKNDLVSRAELKAAQDTIAVLADERDFLVEKSSIERDRANALESANADLAQQVWAANLENENLQDDIEERILARPVGSVVCTADDDLIKRLRNRR